MRAGGRDSRIPFCTPFMWVDFLALLTCKTKQSLSKGVTSLKEKNFKRKTDKEKEEKKKQKKTEEETTTPT